MSQLNCNCDGCEHSVDDELACALANQASADQRDQLRRALDTAEDRLVFNQVDHSDTLLLPELNPHVENCGGTHSVDDPYGGQSTENMLPLPVMQFSRPKNTNAGTDAPLNPFGM